MRPHLLDDRIEHRRFADGQLAEHLAIELESRRGKRGDETIVVDPALFQRRAQTRDAQRAEVPLLVSAVAIGVNVRLARELQRLAVQRAGAGAEAGGSLQDALTLAGMCGTVGGARHWNSF